jgi:hypothetical protein
MFGQHWQTRTSRKILAITQPQPFQEGDISMSLNLQDVCDQFDRMGFPEAQDARHPELETVKLARCLIEQAIASDSFLLDCIGHELRLIETSNFRSGLIPFYVHPRTGIQFSFGYWSPGSSPGPHAHTAWTLTALCRNTLNVITYNTEAALQEGKLIEEKNLDAQEGQVGFIHDVCVHNPSNNSSQWSWTLHVTSPRDGQDLEQYPNDRFRFEQAPEFDGTHPFADVVRTRQRITRLRYLNAILSTLSSDKAQQLQQRCIALGTQSMQNTNPDSSNTNGSDVSHRLTLTNKHLKLACLPKGSNVALLVDTPQGMTTALQMDRVAEPALSFVANQQDFDIRHLPGEITTQEQHQIGETLENLGLFRSTL